MTPKETVLDLPVGVWESPVKMWVGGGLLQGWGQDCSNTCMGSFEGSHHYLNYLHHSLAPGKGGRDQGGNTAPPINKNWIKDLLSTALPIRTRPSVPLSQSILSRSFNKLLGPIISWEIDGETVETVSDFVFWGSKITADGDCSHEIKRRLLLGRKVMTNQDS